MQTELVAQHGVMEGGGAYNRHAKVPAAGGNLALPFLEQAVRNITLDGETSPSSLPITDHRKGRTRWLP